MIVYFKCVGWHDGKRVSRCLNAPCIDTVPDIKCRAGLTNENHQFCRRKMEEWELLELKDMLAEIEKKHVLNINCRFCSAAIPIGELVNVSDEFYVHKDCLDKHWNEILSILFKESK